MIQELKNRITCLTSELNSIKRQSLKYLQNNSKIGSRDELFIFHRPWIAPMNWGLMLFPKTENDWIEQFETKSKKYIPKFYRNFLNQINGCFIYDISLYGLTPSIFSSNQLNRSNVQCHDLLSANNSWIREYNVEKSFFHFGSSHFSETENLGYFVDGNQEIFSMLKDGKVISTWKHFDEFLFDEIGRAENNMKLEIPKGIEIRIEN